MLEKPTETGLVPLVLLLVNVIGIFIGYSISILLARFLTHDGFEQYVGAIATLGVLASLAEGGFGKYGLKVVPRYVANLDRSLLAGYLRFAFIGCVLTSLSLGLVAASIETSMRAGPAEKVILLAIVFLPAMAGVGVAIDLLLAFRMARTATLIARILVPLTTLVLVGLTILLGEISPFLAVLCFAIGSSVGLVISLGVCWYTSRSLIAGATAKLELPQWIRGGLSFFAFGFLTSWIFRATLVLTHHLPHSGDELAMLAPAFETGCLILLLSKSTDKYFQPTMSVILESCDWEYGVTVRRKRYILVGCMVIVFLAVIFLFGSRILGLYGEDFESAYPSLCLVASGASVWTLFSLAPTFLMFAGERKKLLLSFGSHAILMAVLTTILLQRFGATGAAAAFAISITSLAMTNLIFANHQFGKLKSATLDSNVS